MNSLSEILAHEKERLTEARDPLESIDTKIATLRIEVQKLLGVTIGDDRFEEIIRRAIAQKAQFEEVSECEWAIADIALITIADLQTLLPQIDFSAIQEPHKAIISALHGPLQWRWLRTIARRLRSFTHRSSLYNYGNS